MHTHTHTHTHIDVSHAIWCCKRPAHAWQGTFHWFLLTYSIVYYHWLFLQIQWHNDSTWWQEWFLEMANVHFQLPEYLNFQKPGECMASLAEMLWTILHCFRSSGRGWRRSSQYPTVATVWVTMQKTFWVQLRRQEEGRQEGRHLRKRRRSMVRC